MKDFNSIPVLILIVLLGLLLFLHSPYFALQGIEVVGNSYFQSEELLASISLPLEKNIFKIDRNSLAEELLENPLIAEIKLQRRLPDGLLIEVNEKRPLMYLVEEEEYLLIGEGGLVLRREAEREFQLPSMREKASIKEDQLVLDGGWEPALKYLHHFSSEDLPLISGVYFQSEDQVVLQLNQGGRVFLGDSYRKEQAEMLLEIYQRLEQDKAIKYIDLRFEDNPVVKYND